MRRLFIQTFALFASFFLFVSPVFAGHTAPPLPVSSRQAGTGTIEGTIYNADHTAIIPNPTAVRINVHDYNTRAFITGTSATSLGTYTISGLTPGTYRVEAKAPGYVVEYYLDQGPDVNQGSQVSVVADTITPDIDFTLEPGGTIAGTVRRSDTNDIVPNMAVQASVGIGTCTDAFGKFTLENLPLNQNITIASGGSGNWCGNTTSFFRQWYQQASVESGATPISLTSAAPDKIDADFLLDPAATIRGTVSSSSGVMGGARVVLQPYSGGPETFATTDGTGTYRFDGLAAGSYRVRADKSGYGGQFYNNLPGSYPNPTSVDVVAGEDKQGINFLLPLAGTISGHVTVQGGGPIPANTVSILDICDGVDAYRSNVTDVSSTDGSYAHTNLYSSSYKISVQAPSYAWVYYGAATWEEAPCVPVGENQTITIDLVLSTPAGSISGTIYKEDGVTPIDFPTAVTVLDYYTHQYVDMSILQLRGRWQVSNLPAGDYLAFASGEGFATEYYNNAGPDPAAGTKITVLNGQAVTDINFSLSPADTDGVSAAIEAGAPNSGDGNGDGVPDNQQDHVTSLPNPVDGSYVTLVTPTQTDLTSVAAIPNPSPVDMPAQASFPIGFFEFDVVMPTQTQSITLTFLLQPGDVAINYYKYGPTPDNPAPHWYEFVFDGTTGAQIGPSQIILYFVDGQRGDSDLTVNGIIRSHNSAPVLVHYAPPTQPSTVNVVPAGPPISGPCADFTGHQSPVIRALIPAGTVTSGGVYCRTIAENGAFITSAAEIGSADISLGSVWQAIDVFGMRGSSGVQVFNQPVQVCLSGEGDIRYLDATTSPRVLRTLPTSISGSFSCASIPNAGTVVLTKPYTGAGGSAAPAAPSSTPLNGCRVTTLNILNLRTDPSLTADVMDLLPYNTTYTATERVPGWYRVIYLDRQGWISETHVTAGVSCGG